MGDDKHSGRLRRQFEAFKRLAPPSRPVIDGLLSRGMRPLRVPLAAIFILGGVFSFLPLLGLWMLPLGLLLLAVDLPALRAPMSALAIRTRRRLGPWLRRRRRT